MGSFSKQKKKIVWWGWGGGLEEGSGRWGDVATLIATISYFTVIIVKKIALKILVSGVWKGEAGSA